MSQLSKDDRQLNNSKAQLLALKNEIEVVSRELGNLLSRKINLEEDVTIKQNSLNNIINETNIIEKKYNDFNKYILEQSKVFATKQVEIEKQYSLLEETRSKTLNELDTVKQKYNNEIVTLQNTRENLFYQISEMNDDLNTLEGKQEEFNVLVDKLEKDVIKLDTTLSEKVNEYSSTVDRLEKEIKSKTKELTKLTEEVFKEQRNIEKPLLALADEEARLDRKQRNLDIMIDRFKKYMKVHFPDQDIKL